MVRRIGFMPHGADAFCYLMQAAAALRLPYYWFADHAMRSKYRIPHYLMGGLVRYRLSELSTWAARNAAAQSRFAGDTDTAVEEAE